MATEQQVPSIHASGAAASGTGTSLNVPYPTIASEDSGKLLILTYVNGSSTNLPSTPSGWLIVGTATGTGVVTRVYRKLSDGTESGNLSLTGLNSGDSHIARIHLFDGADLVEGASTNTGSSKNPAHASVTTSGDDRLVLSVMGINDDETASSYTGETGGDFTLTYNDTSTVGNDVGMSLQEAPVASSGTISGGSWSYSGAGEDWADVSFAVYAGTLPNYVQLYFRGKDDVGGETDTTWLASRDVDFSVALDTNFRIRFLIRQTLTTPTPGQLFAGTVADDSVILEYRVNTGGGYGSWTNVPAQGNTSDPTHFVLSSNFADGDTTEQIGVLGTFRGGRIEENGPEMGLFSSEQRTEEQQEFWEFEACLILDSDNTTAASDGDLFQYRVVRKIGGTEHTLDTYTATPTVTVASGAFTLAADAGSLTIAGQAANLEQGYLVSATAGSVSVNAQAVALSKGKRVAADVGSVDINAQAVTLTRGRCVVADVGTLGIDAQTAGLFRGYPLTADIGTIDINAQAAELLHGYSVIADAATISIDGQAATFLKTWTVSADVGTLSIDGQAVGLAKGKTLTAAAATIDLNAQAANLLQGYVISADAGTLGINAQAANLLYGQAVSADVGTLTIAGQAVDFLYGYSVEASAGSLDINAQAANLLAGKNLAADAGTLDLNAQAAGLFRGYPLTADVASVDINAQAAGLEYGRTLDAAAGTLTISGQATGLLQGYLVDAAAGTLAINGQAVTLNYSGSNPVLTADAGSIDLNAQATNLLQGYLVTGAAGTIDIDALAANVLRGYPLAADVATVDINAQSVEFLRGYSIVADAGSIDINAQATNLEYGFVLSADAATLDINAQAAGLLRGRTVGAQPATLVIAGATSDLLHGYLLTAAAGGLNINAQAAGLIHVAGNVLSAEAGAIEINAQNADLRYSGSAVSRGGILLPGAERPTEWLRRSVAEQLGDKLDEIVTDVRTARTKSRRKRKITAAQHKMNALEEIVAQEYVPPDVRGHLDAIRSALNAAVGAADEYSMLRQAVVNNAKMVQDRANEDRRRRRRRDEEAVTALLMSI